MKSRHILIETRLLKNLLRLETCFLEKNLHSLERNKNYFLGFRKGLLILDLEKSVLTYFKVLQVVKSLKSLQLKILFVGCPSVIEKKAFDFLFNSHFFICSKNWKLGKLSNYFALRKKFQFLIVFGQKFFFSYRETFNNTIPSVGFIDSNTKSSLIDFPIFLNLNSRAAISLFLYLINQAV